MEASNFYKYTTILLVIIAIAVIAIAFSLVYTVIKIQPAIQNINNISQTVNQGLDNAKKDVANIKYKGQNTVQNLVADARTALPSVFNWLENK